MDFLQFPTTVIASASNWIIDFFQLLLDYRTGNSSAIKNLLGAAWRMLDKKIFIVNIDKKKVEFKHNDPSITLQSKLIKFRFCYQCNAIGDAQRKKCNFVQLK